MGAGRSDLMTLGPKPERLSMNLQVYIEIALKWL